MAEDRILHVEIEADSLDELRSFADENPLDFGCVPVARRVGSRYVAQAYLTEEQLSGARSSQSAARVVIRIVEDATETGLRRQQEVGQGNRYANRSETPSGLGQKE